MLVVQFPSPLSSPPHGVAAVLVMSCMFTNSVGCIPRTSDAAMSLGVPPGLCVVLTGVSSIYHVVLDCRVMDMSCKMISGHTSNDSML